jgi:hypothetical protein
MFVAGEPDGTSLVNEWFIRELKIVAKEVKTPQEKFS